jgi:glycosyltransferase involved in cell wall biosynthesis
VRVTFTERGVDPKKIEVIYYALRREQFESVTDDEVRKLRKDWGVAEGDLVFGFVGRLVEEKSIDTLLRAYALYQKQAGVKSHLVIAGDGALRKSLEAMADQLSLKVNFLGFRADIPLLMKSYDVFVLSSVTEGFGLVLLEAMAAHTPIITTNVGAIPEVVDNSAIMVNPQKPEEMSAAMKRMESASLRDDFRKAGLERLNEKFSLTKMFHETEALYNRVTGKTKT